MKTFLLYLLRWQLSTPILAPILYFLAEPIGTLPATILANLVGGIIFFYVDKKIFSQNRK